MISVVEKFMNVNLKNETVILIIYQLLESLVKVVDSTLFSYQTDPIRL